MALPSAPYTASVVALAPENCRDRNTDSGTIACFERSSSTKNAESSATPTTPMSTVEADQLVPGPSMSEYTTPPKASMC